MLAGLWLFARGVRRLRRRAVFSPTFWSSARHYPGYRLRALRPALATAVGLGLAAGGGFAVYAGLTGFYASRLLFR